MKKFDTRTYSISDYAGWHERDEIILQPKFQRRNVWSDKARSYLMDTIIRGKPMPKIFIRQSTNPRTRKTIREVVDGQQRLRTIFSFLSDGFSISRVHNEEFGGRVFSVLPEDIQRDILQYELATDLLLDAPDEEVLDIFARLNSYSVRLNAQELLNAKYFGEFKQAAYTLAREFLAFWTQNKIFTDRQILRMTEAELTSDLLGAMLEGIKAKKQIPNFYQKYDDSFPSRDVYVSRFRETMDVIGEIMQGTLVTSEFRRVHLFYSLFCSIYHYLFRLPDFDFEVAQSLKLRDYAKVRIALEKVDEIYAKTDEERTSAERRFLEAARRATTDGPVRVFRSLFICQLIADGLMIPNGTHKT